MSQMVDNNLKTPEDPVTEVMPAVIECFVEWIESEEPNNQKGHQVLRALGKESFKLRTMGREIRCLDADYLAQAADKPKEWIDWIATEKYFNARKNAVIELSKRKGLKYYPDFKRNKTTGGPGNVTTCEIVATPIPEESLAKTEQAWPEKNEYQNIIYSRSSSGEVKLGWLWRIIFQHGKLRLSKWVKRILMTWIFGVLLMVVFVVMVLLSSLSAPRPITTQHIEIIIIVVALPTWFWFSFLMPFSRLFDDRIKPVSESMLAFGEDNAQMEIYREGETSVIRIVRYSAVCSICEASVGLSDGSPDFPRRMVGRCADSPREHVFSFDRVTLRGAILRSPPLK